MLLQFVSIANIQNLAMILTKMSSAGSNQSALNLMLILLLHRIDNKSHFSLESYIYRQFHHLITEIRNNVCLYYTIPYYLIPKVFYLKDV